MKAISMWQPWASLLVLGIKKYETRGRCYSITNRQILIQAAMRLPTAKEISEEADEIACRALGVYWRRTVPRGAIVGRVEFTSSSPAEALRPFQSSDEKSLGNWGDSRWVYLALRPVLFARPIPCRGMQAMPFQVPAEALDALKGAE